MIPRIVLLVFLIEGLCGARFEYSESDYGPTWWHKYFPNCKLNHQSPINIDTTKAKLLENPENLLFLEYDNVPTTWKLSNNGHTLQLSADFPKWTPQIQGGGLPAKYYFLQGHFHWGPDDFRGSEHHLDGRQFSLELHLVHARRPVSDLRADKEDSRPSQTRLAVVGIFFEVSDKESPEIKLLLDQLSKIKLPGSAVTFASEDLILEKFLPDNRDFYRYNGSLTTPACDEAVVWSVLPSPKKISAAQLAQFRTLFDEKNQTMTTNYRPVQPLNNREITFHSRKSQLRRMAAEPDQNGAAKSMTFFGCSFALIILSILLYN